MSVLLKVSPPTLRKRTLEASTVKATETSPTSSLSTQSPIPSFQFSDETSPGSTASVSMSTPSSSPFSQPSSNCASPMDSNPEGQWPGASPRVTLTRDEDGSGGKRRRTSPASKSLPLRDGTEGKGKERAIGTSTIMPNELWAADVDAAFREALTVVPKLKLVKTWVHEIMLGRNQLVGIFMFARTGQFRSHKQISSRVQVLKKSLKDDLELMNLLDMSGPVLGQPVTDFDPAHAETYLALVDVEIIKHYLELDGPARRRETLSPVSTARDGLLSPFASPFLDRPPLPGQNRSPEPPSPPDHFLRSSSSPTSLAIQLENLSIPELSEEPPAPCSIAPAQFSLWTHDTDSDRRHVYASSSTAGVRGTIDLGDLKESSSRYPNLDEMYDHLPCQFLHVRVNLDIPTLQNSPHATQLHTQLSLTSFQDLPLTCITRIYLCGVEVFYLQEAVSPSTLLHSALGSTPTPLRPTLPSHSTVEGHKFTYDAPFAQEFWTTFLRGKFGADDGTSRISSYGKTGAERADIADAVSGLSAIQEYVVLPDAESIPVDLGDISPGSSLGDVVLVLSFDFISEDTPTSGMATVSFLSVDQTTLDTLRSSPAEYFTVRPDHSSPLASSPQPLPSNDDFPTSSPLPSVHISGSPLPSNPTPQSRNQSGLRLSIPAPSTFLSPNSASGSLTPLSGPSTPWLQVMHTPTQPPPFYPPTPSTRQGDRLEKEWANLANPWEDRSPALLGMFPLPSPGLSSGSDSPASYNLGPISPHQFEYDPSRVPYPQAMTELTSMALDEVATSSAGFPQSLSTPLVLEPHPHLSGVGYPGQGGSFFATSSLENGYGRSTFRPSRSIEEELAAVIDSEIASNAEQSKRYPMSPPVEDAGMLREGEETLREGGGAPTGPKSPNSSLWETLMGN